MKKFEKYTKSGEISYALGIFPTFELLVHRPNQAIAVLFHSKLKTDNPDIQKLIALCKKNKIEVLIDDKTINKLSQKDNCFVVGVFKKYASSLTGNKHVVLDNPSDMGNLGTIMRTMLGFEICDLVLTTPCVDFFNPKVIRASMGAIFSLNIVEISSLEQYFQSTSTQKFLFMLNGKQTLGTFKPPQNNFSLIFGNEARGLDSKLAEKHTSVVIEHSKNIDSLNLPISVSLALFEFYKK